MKAFTIKDLENLSGIKAHTIRIWEQRYSFLKPQRSKTNIRYYHSDELKTILNVALLNKYGFKISHINQMSAELMKEKIHALTQAEALQERLLNELLHFMICMDVDKFDELLESNIRLRGVENTISYLVFPFMQKIGILWLTDHITIAQEHLVSNVIRQKLIMGIQNCQPLFRKNKTIALFLPEGEHHEIGLLYIYYLMKSTGISVLYLGTDVPLDDVEFIAREKMPDYICSHITCIAGKFNLERYLTHLHNRIPEIPLIISGRTTNSYLKKVPANIFLKKSLLEVQEYIAAL